MRPMAVAPLLYRLWCRARGHEADDWCSARAGFLGHYSTWQQRPTSGDPANAHERNQPIAAVSICYGVLGLGKFYDSICLHRLIASMLALSFPHAIIVMTFTMYLAPRFLRGQGSVAEPIYPANSILQGCATLPEDFCIVFSTTSTGFIQLS